MKQPNIIFTVLLFSFSAAWSQQHLIPFRCGKLWGYRDQQGNVVIDPQYEVAAFFSEGFAAVRKNKKNCLHQHCR